MIFLFLLLDWKLHAATEYIDSAKPPLEDERFKGSYTQKVKNTLPEEDKQSFIDQQKQHNPALQEPNRSSFIEEQSKTLPPPKDVSLERLEYVFQKPKKPLWRFGIRFTPFPTTLVKRNFIYKGQNNFKSIYPSNHIIEANFHGEYFLYRHPSWVSLGAFFNISGFQYSGYGQFAAAITTPNNDATQTSNVEFRFTGIPVALGLSLRLLALKYIVPFVNAGASILSYLESRGDNIKSGCQFSFLAGSCGISGGYTYSAGVEFLMDWIYTKDAALAYQTTGIYHSYLTFEYSYAQHLYGPMEYNLTRYFAGFSCEF